VTTPEPSGLSFDATQPTWDALARQVDALLAAWAAGRPPPLADFLPAGPPALRRLVLVELVKVDLEQRLAHDLTLRPVEDYAAEFTELADDGVPCDLLYEEFHLRRRHGEAVQPGEFYRRFPERAAELARLLGEPSAYQATTVAATAQPAVELQVGDRVDDFDLLTLLGEGAFAKVFLARQRSLQRLVALKVSADRGVEPQTLAQLDHPHIVRVYDQRLLPHRRLRLLYMPYLAGGTLLSALEHLRTVPLARRSGRTLVEAIDRVLERRGELPPGEAPLRQRLAGMTWPRAVAWLGARLADALHYAHSQGVLHRDIKPANVLLAADGSPRLADFNVGYCSKLEGASPRAFFGGSLVYMSPEQIEAYNPAHDRTAESLDARSDIYSLGVTLWELLTGERPFGVERVAGNVSAALAELTRRRRAGLPPGAADAVPPDCPPGLERALRRCLDPDPAGRFPDAAALAAALELCLHPRAAALLDPPPGDWRHVARRHPIACMLAAGLTPNVVAAGFNLAYNYTQVISAPGATPGLEPAFWTIQNAINLTCFPLGVLLFVWLARPVPRGLARLRAGEELPAAQLAGLRRLTLRLGWYGMWIGLGFWLVASLIYPVVLTAAVPGLPEAETRRLYAHFLGSLTVCGLIAAAYPFFCGTALGTGALLPAFLRPGTAVPADADALRRLERALWPFLGLAAAVPLLAVAALVRTHARSEWVLLALCVAGLVGLGVAVLLARRIQRDLADLTPVVCGPTAAPEAEPLAPSTWGD
jgi:serine/threonine protein kinase